MYINLLGTRIAELRRNRNITQYQLAEIIGMSTSTIAMWETGKRDPDSKMLSTMANTFKVTTDYLLGLSNDKGYLQMTFTQPELLILLESLNHLQLSVKQSDEREIRELKDKIRTTIIK